MDHPKINVTEEYLIGADITCLICRKSKQLGTRTRWQIDYERIYDDIPGGPNVFCGECRDFSATCLSCGATTTTGELDGWFYDYLFLRDEERYFEQQADLCPGCHVAKGTTKGPAKCGRCGTRGEWGIGKWNDNEGHIDCYHCDMIVCYKCHELLHYNK